MFNIFIDPNIKAERTQFSQDGVLFLDIAVGGFADVVQVLSLIAWSLETRPDWTVKDVYYDGDTLEVRIARTAEEEPEEEPEEGDGTTDEGETTPKS